MADILPLRIADPLARSEGATIPLAVDARGLALMLSSSIRWVRTQDAAGKLPAPIRVAGRVLWNCSEIEAWLRSGAPCRSSWEAVKAVSRK